MTSSDDLESALSRWLDDDLSPAESADLRRRLRADPVAAALLGEYRRVDDLLVSAAGDLSALDAVDFDALALTIGASIDEAESAGARSVMTIAPEPLRLPAASEVAVSGGDVLPPSGWRIGPGTRPVQRVIGVGGHRSADRFTARFAGRFSRAAVGAAVAAGAVLAIGGVAWFAQSPDAVGGPRQVAYAPVASTPDSAAPPAAGASASESVAVVTGPARVAPADLAPMTVTGPVVASSSVAASAVARVEVGVPSSPDAASGEAFVGFAPAPIAAPTVSPAAEAVASAAGAADDDRPLVASAPFVRPSRIFIAARGVPREVTGLY